MSDSKLWRCSACGYVHGGDCPPDFCPVCGAAKTDFEPYSEPASDEKRRFTRWQCLNCNYVHEGDSPPDLCPVCGAAREKFEPIEEKNISGAASAVNLVIAGGGVAGVSAAESVRKASPDSQITLICTEGELPYYRLNLTRYLAGEISRDSLPLHSEKWFDDNRIELIRGISVENLLPAERNISLAGGRRIPYGKLILATGSHPYVPPLPGNSLRGVFTLRTSSDADEILDGIGKGSRAVLIGGGILGLETAGALAKQGADITLFESHGWLMPRQLNQKGAEILERHIARIGVKVLKNARTRQMVGRDRVEAVELDDGRKIPAEIVVVATGVRPNTAIARKAGIEVNTGIVVDNHLRTSQPDVFAAGDVAEHNGLVYGSWAASQAQGCIAGLNAAGIPALFGGLPRSNTVKALGLDLTSIGKFQPEDGSYLVVEEEGENSYLEFVFRDGRMAGAIIIGRPELAASAKKAIESGKDFSGALSSGISCGEIAKLLGLVSA